MEDFLETTKSLKIFFKEFVGEILAKINEKIAVRMSRVVIGRSLGFVGIL